MAQQKIKKDMAKELDKYKQDSVYLLNKIGGLIRIYIDSLDDYNHNQFNLHHYIPYSNYVKNEQWYKDRGIKQKLILMSIKCHEHVHDNGIVKLTDAQFEKKYKISRSKLLFNRRQWESAEKGWGGRSPPITNILSKQA